MPVNQVFIVRRGNIERFRALRETFGDPPISANVIWDRRQGDRRLRAQAAASDRRRAGRRGQEPSSWSALDFLTAPSGQPVDESGIARAPAKPVDCDLLVHRETSANGPCSVSTVPGPAHVLLPSYEEASAYAERLADRNGVNIWYTEDDRVFTAVRRARVQSAAP